MKVDDFFLQYLQKVLSIFIPEMDILHFLQIRKFNFLFWKSRFSLIYSDALYESLILSESFLFHSSTHESISSMTSHPISPQCALCEQDAVLIEVHQGMGTDYKTLAVGRLSLRDLFDKPSGRLHSTAPLTGTDAFGAAGVPYSCNCSKRPHYLFSMSSFFNINYSWARIEIVSFLHLARRKKSWSKC